MTSTGKIKNDGSRAGRIISKVQNRTGGNTSGQQSFFNFNQ